MDEAPTWKKGGLTRRGIAFVIDLIVVMIATQLLASLLFPLSNGILIDSTAVIISCEPAGQRPQNIETAPDFRPTAEQICTKSFFGQPVARFYTMSRQEPGSSVTTSVSHSLDRQDRAALTFDLSLLQLPLLALMRWLVEAQGWQSPGRQATLLYVLPRAGVSARPALGRRYLLFALPYAVPMVIATVLFAALQAGLAAPGDLTNALLFLSRLPETMAVIVAVTAIARSHDAFYDEGAGTSVVYIPEEIETAAQLPQLAAPEPKQAAEGGSLIFPFPWATCALAGALVLVFLGELAMSFARTQVVGVAGPILVLFGAMSGELVWQLGQWYRLVCSVFLHGSAAHLLGPQAPVEGFDERTVGRLARTGGVQRDAALVRPEVEVTRDELGALVDPDRLRIARLRAGPFEHGNDVLRPVAEAWVDDGGEKRLYVSTTVSTRIFLPVASWSWTKSIAQTSFGLVAGVRSSRSLALTRRFGVLLRNCSPNSL